MKPFLITKKYFFFIIIALVLIPSGNTNASNTRVINSGGSAYSVTYNPSAGFNANQNANTVFSRGDFQTAATMGVGTQSVLSSCNNTHVFNVSRIPQAAPIQQASPGVGFIGGLISGVSRGVSYGRSPSVVFSSDDGHNYRPEQAPRLFDGYRSATISYDVSGGHNYRPEQAPRLFNDYVPQTIGYDTSGGHSYTPEQAERLFDDSSSDQEVYFDDYEPGRLDSRNYGDPREVIALAPIEYDYGDSHVQVLTFPETGTIASSNQNMTCASENTATNICVGDPVVFRVNGGVKSGLINSYSWTGDEFPEGVFGDTITAVYHSPGVKNVNVTANFFNRTTETIGCAPSVTVNSCNELGSVTEGGIALNQVPYKGPGDTIALYTFFGTLILWSILVVMMVTGFIRKKKQF